MTDSTKGFTLERLLDAKPEEIWNAWTDPDEAAQWWHPRRTATPRETVAIDARVGGRYTYTMVSEDTGEEVLTGGEFVEVVPFERLVFTWGSPDDDSDEMPIVVVAIASAGELSRMTFELQGADGAPGDEYFYDGWDQALDSLTEHLGQTAVRG